MSRSAAFARPLIPSVIRWPSAQRLAAGALLALALGLPASARAQAADTVLYAVNNTTTLYAITNRAAGSVAAGSFATLSFAAIAVARDPVSGRIFYASGAAPVGRIAYYDPATGLNTTINAAGTAPNNILRLAFNSAGVLYALGDSARLSVLYTINTTTGAYTSLGSVRIGTTVGPIFPNSGDMAFHPTTGVLYATTYADANNCNGNCNGSSATALYTINLANRVATKVGDDFGPATTQTSLAFIGSTLYSGGANGSLYTLSLTTAAATTIAATSAVAFQDFTTGIIGADLQVTLTASGSFITGSSVTYTMTAKNNGPYPATGTITLVDTLPAGFGAPTASGTGWTCGVSGQVVTCTRAGPMASAFTAPVVNIVVVVAGAATSVTNTAHVFTLSTPDQNPLNDASSLTSAVTVYAVSTTPDGATITRLPSKGVSYSDVFVVTNAGTMPDTYSLSATVAPAGIVMITQVNGVPVTTGTTGVLAAGASATVTVTDTVAAAAATGAVATITLTATSTTIVTVKDAGDVTVTVARAGLSITKQLYRDNQTTLINGAANVAMNEYVQYKVTVTSTGAASASAVSVADVIPAQVTYQSATGDLAGWTFVKPAGTLTATLAGTLASGTSRYFWIRVRVK